MRPGLVVKLRRCSQLLFFFLFVVLLFRTELKGALGAGGEIRLHSPVRLFFLLDPLVAISNALATRALYQGLILSLIILIPTLFFGRFFCGWICPMGSLNHFLGNLKWHTKRGKNLIQSNRYKPWQTTKYYILLILLVAAFFGSGIVGWFDPFSLLVRSIGLSILPAFNYAVNAVFTSIEGSHIPGLAWLAGAIHGALRGTLLSFKQPMFLQGVLLGFVFLTLLALNLRVTRFWCRALCPLGALLGVVSRWSIFGLHKDAATCNQCNKCEMHCQGGDDPIGGAKWRKAECHMCMNCTDSCPHQSLQFKFFRKEPEVVGTSLDRRKAITGIAAGALVVPLMRSTPGLAKGRDEHLIRPPGSLDETDFLSRCIRCGECMKVCPNNSLQPTFTEAGVEGMWTPMLQPKLGYCEPSCVLCSEVCPTGAIWKITPKEKGWVVGVGEGEKPIRLGTAFYDRGRCLPWAMATDCIVCEEWCPVSPKAIYVEEAQVIDSEGKVKTLKQPRVDPQRCVGCGACEYACPLQEHPAVHVTSIGESRSSANQILLRRKNGKVKS
jgi:polyferredoxin